VDPRTPPSPGTEQNEAKQALWVADCFYQQALDKHERSIVDLKERTNDLEHASCELEIQHIKASQKQLRARRKQLRERQREARFHSQHGLSDTYEATLPIAEPPHGIILDGTKVSVWIHSARQFIDFDTKLCPQQIQSAVWDLSNDEHLDEEQALVQLGLLNKRLRAVLDFHLRAADCLAAL
jgi:hypothetical protein